MSAGGETLSPRRMITPRILPAAICRDGRHAKERRGLLARGRDSGKRDSQVSRPSCRPKAMLSRTRIRPDDVVACDRE